MKRPELRTDGRELVEEQAAEPPAPAPAVVPGSLEWASAVGNQAVARLAAEQAPAPEEEAAAPAEGEEQQLAPEDEEAAAAVAAVDEEQLPES
jgi:hypothetical protein